jgi:hypothetical protein
MEALRARHSMKPSRRVSITSIMTALALIGNYWLVSIPNVELGSTILFATAFVFGFPMGIFRMLSWVRPSSLQPRSSSASRWESHAYY